MYKPLKFTYTNIGLKAQLIHNLIDLIYKRRYNKIRKYKNMAYFPFLALKNDKLDYYYKKLNTDAKMKLRYIGFMHSVSAKNLYIAVLQSARILHMIDQVNQTYGTSYYGRNFYTNKKFYPDFLFTGGTKW